MRNGYRQLAKSKPTNATAGAKIDFNADYEDPAKVDLQENHYRLGELGEYVISPGGKSPTKRGEIGEVPDIELILAKRRRENLKLELTKNL